MEIIDKFGLKKIAILLAQKLKEKKILKSLKEKMIKDYSKCAHD